MNANDSVAKRTSLFCAGALILALASIIVTRALRLFSLAEILAVAAFLTGLLMWIAHRRSPNASPLDWPPRLIVAASFIGLGGLAVKMIFVLLGIGTGGHDMQGHESSLNARALEHIHHLFFNLGFLLMAVAAIGMAFRRITSRRTTA